MQPLRILAIDFGEKRLGLAITDERQVIALPLPVLLSGNSPQKTIEALLKAISPYLPLEKIVLGLPLHMNGQESPLSKQVRAFATLLEATSAIPCTFVDERLTSLEAERRLQSAGFNRRERATKSDSLAAVIILESLLGNYEPA